MKTKEKTVHWLSELTNRIAENNRQAAMKSYLEGKIHFKLCTASILTKYCEHSTEELRKGNVEPQLDLFCNAKTFKLLLTCEPTISYQGCELPLNDEIDDDDFREPEPKDEELDDARFLELSKLTDDELAKTLMHDYGCDILSQFIFVHKEDKKLQRDYYQSVLERFRAAAEYAASIGSESARTWLDAVRLMMPETLPPDEDDYSQGLNLIEENVALAYARAEEAQGQLWVDVELGKISKSKKRN